VKYNSELGLGLRSAVCENMAIEIFDQVFKNFKKKREDYDRGCLLSHFDTTNEVFIDDPARNNENLEAILSKNRQDAAEKFEKIHTEYAYRYDTKDKEDNGQDHEETLESEESMDDNEIETDGQDYEDDDVNDDEEKESFETDYEDLPVLVENNNVITSKTTEDFSFIRVCRAFEEAISSVENFKVPNWCNFSI
jgi:hypothetical protein